MTLRPQAVAVLAMLVVGPLTIPVIARRLGMSTSTGHELVRCLVKSGAIKVDAGKVSLTERGREWLDANGSLV